MFFAFLVYGAESTNLPIVDDEMPNCADENGIGAKSTHVRKL